MNSDFQQLWIRNLFSRRRKTLANILLIVLVMIPLVLCLVFVDSMIDGITEKYILLSGGQIQFTAEKAFVPDDLQMQRTLNAFCVMYSADSHASVMMKGVGEGFFDSNRLEQISLEDGWETGGNKVLISSSVASVLGVKTGDKVAVMLLTNPDDAVKGDFNPVFRPAMLSVGGIFTSGYRQLDDNIIFSDIDWLLTVCKGETVQIEVLTGTNDTAQNRDIAENLMRTNPMLLGYTIWNERNTEVFENFVNSKQMILIIMIVIGAIACVYCGTIASEVFSDNRVTICTMRLLGASESQVRRTVFLYAFIVIVAGVLAGTAVGLLIAFNLAPLLRVLSGSGFSGFAMYLLDFDIRFSIWSLLGMDLMISLAAGLALLLSMRGNRKTAPLELLQS